MRKWMMPFVVIALALAACGSSKKATSSTTAAGSTGSTAAGAASFTPVTANTLTVITSLPAPGFFNGNDPDSLTGGLEWSMAKEMAKRLGLANVKFKNADFDAIVAGQVKDYDIALSQITITDKRKQVNDYSDPYFSSDQGIMVNKGTSVKSLADAKGLQWGVQQGTTGQDYIIGTVKPTKEPKVFQDTPSMFQALLNKSIDAVLLDTAIVLPQTKASGYENTEVVGQFITGEQYGAQLPKGSKNTAVINGLIAAMKSDGTLASLAKANFGIDPSTVPAVK